MNAPPLMIPLVLLCIAAPLGAIDVLYFHLWKFRLYARRASRAETATHLLRGVLVPGVAFVLALYEPRGAWFWALVVGFGIDFVNNVLDVALEPKSRASLGGIPPLEYVIHIVGASATGVIGAAFVFLAYPLSSLPTALAPTSFATPTWLVANGLAVAVGGLLVTATEGTLFVRAILKDRNSEPLLITAGLAR